MTDLANSSELVDRIVAGVLEQWHAGHGAATAPISHPKSADQSVRIADDVITGATLEAHELGSKSLVINPKAVLTPSAREFLSKRKIAWARGLAKGAASSHATWLAVVSKPTPAVRSALDASGWKHELVGCHREAAARGVAAICRGECDGALIFTGKPESAACLANRNDRVRAAAVATAARIKAVRTQMAANLFAVDPADFGLFAIRNLLRESSPAASQRRVPRE